LAFETTYGANELTWADIRSEQMASVWKAVYGTPQYQELDQHLLSIVATVEKGIKKNLGTTAFREILDDVSSDFRGCLYSRAFQGAGAFFESVFQVYKAGCWPCGWKGMYPEGEIVAFMP